MPTRLRFFLLTLLALSPVIAGCQADGDPEGDVNTVSSGQEGDPSNREGETSDDPDGEDDSNNDVDDENTDDEHDDNSGDQNQNQVADCEDRASFLPLTRGARGLNVKLDADAEIDKGCRDCEVINEKAVIGPNLLKSARIMIPAGVIDGAKIIVELENVRYGVENVGFLVATPEGRLSAELLGNIELVLANNGRSVARSAADQDAVQLYETSDSYRHLLIMGTEQPFDAIQIRLNGYAYSSAVLEVYAACVNRYGWE